MKSFIAMAIVLAIATITTQCESEENNNLQPRINLSVGSLPLSSTGAIIVRPTLNKPCLDPGNVFNQKFHRGDTLFANGINLGKDSTQTVMILRRNGVSIANVPFNVAPPYARGSFVIPFTLSNGMYDVVVKVGNLSGNNSETFSVIF
jgi:hypothetical protein